MKNVDNGINIFQKIIDRPAAENDPTKELHWDGYHWISRDKQTEHKSYDILKPGKTIQIANIPIQLNITVTDFKEYIITKMLEKNVISSKERIDFGDKLIRGLELNANTNIGIMTMFNDDIAKRMCLLDGTILLGCTLRISPFIETKYEENTHKGNIALANSADFSAKSAAVAYAALNSFVNSKDDVKDEKKDQCTDLVNANTNNQIALFGKFKNIQLNTSTKIQLVPEEILKVMNVVGKNVITMSNEEYNDMKADVKNEFEKYGNVVNMFVVSRRKYVKIGAELGAIFIEFDDVKYAEMAFYAMQNKKYDGKDFKIAFINKKVFYDDIMPKEKQQQKTNININDKEQSSKDDSTPLI